MKKQIVSAVFLLAVVAPVLSQDEAEPYFSLSSSQYATNVWVIGPAGTQPILNGISARQP